MKIKIDKKFVGFGQPTFIIIEIGSNYNKDFVTAKKMIDMIKKSGADAVKFQIFKEKKLYVKDAGQVDYLKKNIVINELVKRAEVADKFHKRLFDYCKKVGLIYLCTPTDEDVADYLEHLGVVAYKIASYDLTNHFLLQYIAKKNKPMILSTGAGNFSDVEDAVKVIKRTGNHKIILLQCVAQYPAEYKYTNLYTMALYEKKFGFPAGISDHSFDPFIVPYAAVAMGAKLVEKHFTLDRRQEGPDHAFAIEPDELFRMVDGIRKIELAKGSDQKKVSAGEKELRKFAYRSVFTVANISKGDIITRNNSYILRPGKRQPGIDAKFYSKVLGATASKDIKSNQAIKWQNISLRK